MAIYRQSHGIEFSNPDAYHNENGFIVLTPEKDDSTECDYIILSPLEAVNLANKLIKLADNKCTNDDS